MISNNRGANERDMCKERKLFIRETDKITFAIYSISVITKTKVKLCRRKTL